MKIVKPATGPEKQCRSTMDTIELNQKRVSSWKSPPFQRPLKVNAKVMAVSEEIRKNGGVIPGILTIGVLDGETYVVDGQHRLAAWLQTGLDVGYSDVRMHWFENLGQMAEEFVRLNTSLVKLRPDDILRGMEPSTPALQMIRRKCGFIGYDMVRRGHHSPVLSMSTFIRCWMGSKSEVPSPNSSLEAVASLDEAETAHAIEFVGLCFEAWTRDYEYLKLYGALNLSLCAWLYRRAVLGQATHSNSRLDRLSKEEFRKCLMAASAEALYLDWLVGRNLGDRDRSPAYSRLKAIFVKRYQADSGRSLRLPAPAWSAHIGGGRPTR